MKILMVASEATPFSKTGGLADVIGALPAALKHQGHDVAVVTPAYRTNHYPGPIREVYRNQHISLGRGYNVDFYETIERGVPFYFVDCPELFDRAGLYGEGGSDYPDNAIRFAVFSMAALVAARQLFRPQVIHCHDWQTALVPVYIRQFFDGDPHLLGMKLVFTIHNLGYQGLFPARVLPEIGVDGRLFTPDRLEFHGQLNLLKGGIIFSDIITTVSKGYAREIQTPEYGFGLENLLRTRANRLTGIVNGVDYVEWNPETDTHIAQNYSSGDLSGKLACKRALLAEFGLPADKPRKESGQVERPLIGIVSRFVDQKGFDLITQVAAELAGLDLCMTVLGGGEPRYESMFLELAGTFPDKFGVHIGYDNPLAHRIEAGADMFLMPSRYEPCGLNQIYSLRYGTIPIVRATGGLDDTIDPETGFKFREYAGWALFGAIEAALAAFEDRDQWTGMMQRGMQKDFSWTTSAAEYARLYESF
ncbi:MAG: glycogen synthase GlgA [Bryobacteraceae bacterium]